MMAPAASPVSAAPSSSSSTLRLVCLCQGAFDAVSALGLQASIVFPLPPQCSLPPSPSPASHHPSSLQNEVASFGINLNWGILEDLKPDVIFIQDQSHLDTDLPLRVAKQLHQAANIRCRVVSLRSHTVEDVFHNLETIANYCGVRKEGEKLISALWTKWKIIKQKTPQWADGMPRVNVACISSMDPLSAAGYWIPDVISCAGGLSVWTRKGCPDVCMTLKTLLESDPDVVVYLCGGIHSGIISRELSKISTSSEWSKIKAIKTNRFFVIDASRYFIDSAPNVIASVELMAEILHGFEYGHAGKGFIRWQDFSVPKQLLGPENHVQEGAYESSECRTLEVRCLDSKQTHINKCCTFEESATSGPTESDVPKHANNVYEMELPVLANGKEQPSDGLNAGFDVWAKDVGVVMVTDESMPQKINVSTTPQLQTENCLQTMKSIRKMPGDADHCCKTIEDNIVSSNPSKQRQKPATGPHPCQSYVTTTARKSVSSISYFCVYGNKEDNIIVEKVSDQSCSGPGALEKVNSVVERKVLSENSSYERALLSKIWSLTESAANRRSVTSMNDAKKTSMLVSTPKTNTVGYSSSENALTTYLNTLQTALFPGLHSRLDSKRLIGVSMPFQSSEAIPVPESHMNRHSVDAKRQVDGKRRQKGPYSASFGHVFQEMPEKTRQLRDALFRVISDLQSTDCLLLSGGLASSTLAEIVPQVHSKGFKLGFTVLAGPAAKDNAYAEVVAKHKGIEQVIIGDKNKESAILMLAKELPFVVETLKTFDPFQIRGAVPIAAALKEIRNRGCKCVVTGSGLDELFLRDGIVSRDTEIPQLGISKVLSKSMVLLGEALGVKIYQPFLHPKFVEECKSLNLFRSQSVDGARSIWRTTFPEMFYGNRKRNSIEVGTGMHSVTEYFNSAVSTSVLANKAWLIHQKDRTYIRNSEQLVYYRAFKRIFKGKIPKCMVRWQPEACPGCGYRLSADMNWYCLVCGHCKFSPDCKPNENKLLQMNETSRPILQDESDNGNPIKRTVHRHESDARYNDDGSDHVNDKNLERMTYICSKDPKTSMKRIGDASKKFKTQNDIQKGNQGADIESNMSVQRISTSSNSRHLPKKKSQTSGPKKYETYAALLGAVSVGLLLLQQLSK